MSTPLRRISQLQALDPSSTSSSCPHFPSSCFPHRPSRSFPGLHRPPRPRRLAPLSPFSNSSLFLKSRTASSASKSAPSCSLLDPLSVPHPEFTEPSWSPSASPPTRLPASRPNSQRKAFSEEIKKSISSGARPFPSLTLVPRTPPPSSRNDEEITEGNKKRLRKAVPLPHSQRTWAVVQNQAIPYALTETESETEP